MSDFLDDISNSLNQESRSLRKGILRAGAPLLSTYQEAIRIVKNEERHIQFVGSEQYTSFFGTNKTREFIIKHKTSEKVVGDLAAFELGKCNWCLFKLSISLLKHSGYSSYLNRDDHSMSLSVRAAPDPDDYSKPDFRLSPEKAWFFSMGFNSAYNTACPDISTMSGEDIARLFFKNLFSYTGCRKK